MRRFWFENCPECKQGRLFAMKTAQRKIFLFCEECESAWKTPDEIADLNKNFSVDKIKFDFASAEDILAAGWTNFHMKEVLS